MCLAIPAKIITRAGAMGEVDMAGNRREANLSLLPHAEPGDYVMVHAGFAISKYDHTEAQETLKLLGEQAQLMAAEAEGSGP